MRTSNESVPHDHAEPGHAGDGTTAGGSPREGEAARWRGPMEEKPWEVVGGAPVVDDLGANLAICELSGRVMVDLVSGATVRSPVTVVTERG
jgi:hypothetical protein